MGRSEDGEFELILGNKQLLSVFFIVVVLLGVFFTMGYIVGKNSVPAESARREPIVVDPSAPARKDLPPGLVVEPRPEQAAKPSPIDTPPPKKTRVEPSRPVEQPKTAARMPEPEPRKEAKKEPVREPVRTPPVESPTPGARPRLTASGEPSQGQQFLQVVASTKPDCDIIADVLKRKGFTATVVPVTGGSGNIFRVLVGPLVDAAAITRTRSDLESAGFQKPFLRKY